MAATARHHTRGLTVRAQLTVRWDVELHTQRPPDVARIGATLDGRRRGTPTQAQQGVIGQDRLASGSTELGVDQLVKLC